MARRGSSNTRKMKRDMVKNLGVETFSDKIKRQLKERNQCKE